jgi:2-dehydro-3-deoxyphosphogluconate aldolase/(4S)-4-hydroxy-2-oxoglutarate aldolase
MTGTEPTFTRPPIPAAISGTRVVAIGRRLASDAILDIADALRRGGVRAFEVTLDGDGATDAIAALAARFAPEELLVGAGTVLSTDAAAAAARAGARFLVSPHTDPAIVAWATARGLPAFPGALTPTEILGAWRAGAAAVKLFPASSVGPGFVREHRGPFREIPLIPTGGVTVESAPAFIAAGAVAVGIGSWLTGSGDPATVEMRAGDLIRALATAGRDAATPVRGT